MSVTLGHKQYRKADPRVVRVFRDSDPLKMTDSESFGYLQDRPCGLIQGTLHNDVAPSPGLAFDPGQGW